MKYQRVLYTNRLTEEIKSKLRIVSYDKRRALKKNVYFVSFASNADMEAADRIAKRFPGITLKPIQSFPSDSQSKRRISSCNNDKNLPSSSLIFLSPPTTLSFLSDCHSTYISHQPSPAQQTGETLEERARRILGARIEMFQNDESVFILQPPHFVSSHKNANSSNNRFFQCEKKKNQLIDNVELCLKTMKIARQAADNLCQLHKRGLECHEALNFLFSVHSTTFYLKVTTSAQLKAAFTSGIRLLWSDVADIIDALKADIQHQQLFMAQVGSVNYMSSKIDSTTSIAMTSKLAYQLTKLSYKH